MEDLKKTLEVVFTMARMKQVELSPNDEQALIVLINTKKEVFDIIDKRKQEEDAQKAD